MTILGTRVVLLRNLLRGGSRLRIARLLDRLEPADAARLMAELGEVELRRAASVLFEAPRLRRSVEDLPPTTLIRLVAAASVPDAARALGAIEEPCLAPVLASLTRETRARLVEALDGEARERAVKCLPRAERPQPAREDLAASLRLHRLFAS
jgi:hypothetical protein